MYTIVDSTCVGVVFNETATTEIYTYLHTLALHDALPIYARSARTCAFRRIFTNPLLWGAIGLSVVLQVAVVHLPLLNDAFDTTPLSASEWAACAGLASIVLIADEAKKLLQRWLRNRRPID